LISWLASRCAAFGPRPALAGAWGVVSFAQLAGLIDDARRSLAALGLVQPTTFAVIGGHGPAATAWLLALAEAGHFAVPLAGNAAEHPAKLAEVNVQWVVATDGLGGNLLPRMDEPPAHALLRALAARGAAGLVLFSSGTSGRPKAMVQDFGAMLATYESRRPNQLPVLALLGFDHIGGLNTLFGTLAAGALLVVPADRSVAAVVAAIARHRVAVLPASPTFLNLLLAAETPGVALASLRVITYGTEPMPESLLLRLRAAFPRVRFIQTFGTSETGIYRTESPDADSTFLRLDDPGLEWKVVADELWLRSRTQIAGYLNDSNERFTAEGWFRTGDRVETRADGAIRILGRLGEQINVGGEKLMPIEVEAVVLAVPGVLDCRVAGSPSALTGQTVTVDVVLAAGQDEEVVRSALRSACRSQLAPHKVPTKVRFVAAVAGERLKKTR
jgi:acyl-coenzyme A synthetase/AMP-(fatty) acid ligase